MSRVRHTEFGATALLLILLPALIFCAIYVNSNLNHDQISSQTDTAVNWDKYPTYAVELSKSINIVRSGTYYITGELYDGTISVNAPNGYVKIILQNATIKNSAAPAIICQDANSLTVESIGESYIEDGAEYTETFGDISGAIYAKSDLILAGDGLLRVVANHHDGIVSKDNLTVRSGKYAINAENDGLRGKDSVHIAGGELTIDSIGDAIKSDNNEDSTKGTITIDGGNISINSKDDGIHARSSLVINNGNVSILSSTEGLESRRVTINSGIIDIFATDDGINAGDGNPEVEISRKTSGQADKNCLVAINGGEIHINASGDGIDSNGAIYINGGNLIIDGPANKKNGAIDYGTKIVMNGGKALAIGFLEQARNFGEDSPAKSLDIYLDEVYPADTEILIKNTAGEIIFKHIAAKEFSHIAAAAPEFKEDENYILFLDGEYCDEYGILVDDDAKEN